MSQISGEGKIDLTSTGKVLTEAGESRQRLARALSEALATSIIREEASTAAAARKGYSLVVPTISFLWRRFTSMVACHGPLVTPPGPLGGVPA